MSSNGKPAAVMKDLGGIYIFAYEKGMSLLDLLENPERMREQVKTEVMEQWDAIVQAMEARALERLKRRMAAKAASQPVNQTINPQMGQ